jgi:hypothetical protein
VDTSKMSDVEKEGLQLMGEGKPLWVRPAHDGLRVFLSSEGTLKDETYD